MRYPAAETAEKHQKILGEASRLFRERGFGGVSVSEIMKATGLTHGPFYNHFDSKEALMAECVDHASAHSLADLDAATQLPNGMVDYVRAYLSVSHRDAPGDGCLLAAFSAQTAQKQVTAPSLTAHMKASIERFAKFFPWRTRRNADARGDAIRAVAAMTGALVLARAMNDEALSEEILREVLAGIEGMAKA